MSDRQQGNVNRCEGCDREFPTSDLKRVEMKHGAAERLCVECRKDSWGMMKR